MPFVFSDFTVDMDALIDTNKLEELEAEHRLLQDRMDPFRVDSDEEFLKRYCLTKEMVHSLVQHLESQMI